MNSLEDDEVVGVGGTAASTAAPAGAEAQDHAEEESVDDYFTRLMERLQRDVVAAGGEAWTPSEPRAPADVKPVSPERPSASERPALAKSDQLVATPSKREMLFELTPLRTSSENVVDRAKMRELANHNARGATAAHFQKLARREYYKLALVAAAIGISFLLLELSRFDRPSLAFAACATLGVAIWFGARYCVATRRLAALVPEFSGSDNDDGAPTASQGNKPN